MSSLKSTIIVDKYYEENKSKLAADTEALFIAIEYKLIQIIECGVENADLKTIGAFYQDTCKCERDGNHWRCTIYIRDRYDDLSDKLISIALKEKYGPGSKIFSRGSSRVNYDGNSPYIEFFIKVPCDEFERLIQKAKQRFIVELQQNLDIKRKELANIMEDPVIQNRIKKIKQYIAELEEKLAYNMSS